MAIINSIHPNFIATLSAAKSKTISKTQTQVIYEEIIHVAGQTGKTPVAQYSCLYDILDSKDHVHNTIIASGLKEDISVTGGLTEMICEIGLQAVVPNRYAKLPKSWEWFADFTIYGNPFNLYISVKSYKAKERLIASGTGQNTAPIIGYGLFDDPSEWSPDRTKQYKQRGFIAIYMPKVLYDQLDNMRPTTPGLSRHYKKKYSKPGYPATEIKNIYGRPLLRKIEDFSNDISTVCAPASFTMDYEHF